jgi:hypothetical protein
MQTDRPYLFVTPHGRRLWEVRGWSTRPAQLALALAAAADVSILARTHPLATLAAAPRLRPYRIWPLPVFAPRTRRPREPQLLEHFFPAGQLEYAVVRQVARRISGAHAPSNQPAVVICDPRSAGALAGMRDVIRVFDAYDAWDLSPMYQDSPRMIAAIVAGYSTAAKHADLVIANTAEMAARFRQLGARRVELIPNGAPPPRQEGEGGTEVVYVGHIQPRLRIDLITAAADAAAEAGRVLRIIGGIQVEPPGWKHLLGHPAVRFDGPRFGEDLETRLDKAAVGLVPHAVDAFTRSQDAMKVWDYLAWGLSVVSSSVPPVSGDTSLGRVADDPRTFGLAVAAAILDDRAFARQQAQERAVANGWDRRARGLVDLLDLR